MENGFILHGAIVYSRDKTHLEEIPEGYLVCRDGVSQGVYEEIPEEFRDLPVEDFWNCLIIPGLVDLHTHAPQYTFRGLGMDMELLDWLKTHAYPEEARYAKRMYSERAYDLFVEDLYCGATTRAVIFATKYVRSTIRLMDLLDETGLVTYVGKVNMDRNVPDYYIETTEKSLSETERWLSHTVAKSFHSTYPILTPRFTPSCSDTLMEGLARIQKEHQLPVQSHLSENRNEIKWVKELMPDSRFYGEAYSRFGLFGGDVPTVMAHCVYSTPEEVALMKEQGVFIAHCPQSNMNICSGIAPVRQYLEDDLKIGLGSDVAGGSETSIFAAMRDAIHASKMRTALLHPEEKPVTLPEAFYMATLGGGEFFGKVGSFAKGYEFDAVILDDANLQTMRDLTPAERLERITYCSDDRNIIGKYVRGRKLY